MGILRCSLLSTSNVCGFYRLLTYTFNCIQSGSIPTHTNFGFNLRPCVGYNNNIVMSNLSTCPVPEGEKTCQMDTPEQIVTTGEKEKDIGFHNPNPEDKKQEILYNKKGQILSNRAKRRLTKLQLIENKKSKKEEKQKKKLEDPNADKNAGFNEDIFQESGYYFENGLRKVYPYYYTFNSFVKRRWVGRQLIKVFTEEFRAESSEFYKNAIETGTLTVNGQRVNPDYKMAEGDLIQNVIHRHENPVTAKALEVIHEDDDVLVINKPSSIPCHPCGRYRFNSIVFILGKEMKRANLRNIYRLDRLTSGVMVCGKTAKRTAQLEKHIVKREVQKEYVCRVVGEFPDGEITVKEPLDCLSNRIAVWKVTANGKPSETVFEKMSYNGQTSVVKCYPKTGRTHQIRVHLQFLGYPIVNDPIYNSDAFGPLKGKNGDYGKSEAEVIKHIEAVHNVGEWEDGLNPLFEMKMAAKVKSESSKNSDSDLPQINKKCYRHDVVENISNDSETLHPAKRLKVKATEIHPGFDLDKWNPDPNCKTCRKKYLEPKPSDLTMYLHALRYKGPDWDYQTELPEWAKEDCIDG